MQERRITKGSRAPRSKKWITHRDDAARGFEIPLRRSIPHANDDDDAPWRERQINVCVPSLYVASVCERERGDERAIESDEG